MAFAVVMAALTVLMMVDFAYWREQLCLIGCPYGRLQSVLLDRSSLIVGYDERRGEPRGHLKRGTRRAGEEAKGDCVDCGLCTAVCPTGIDIRDGLQMECIHCTQCADACDHVMDRIGRPRGLVRYGSQAAMDGAPGRLLRPRVVAYALLILVLFGVLVTSVVKKPLADVTLLRSLGSPFVLTEEGGVRNTMRLKLRNRTDEERVYRVRLNEPLDAGVLLRVPEISVPAQGTWIEPMHLEAPREAFSSGPLDARITVVDDTGWSTERSWKLLGPRSAAPSNAPPSQREATERGGSQ